MRYRVDLWYGQVRYRGAVVRYRGAVWGSGTVRVGSSSTGYGGGGTVRGTVQRYNGTVRKAEAGYMVQKQVTDAVHVYSLVSLVYVV